MLSTEQHDMELLQFAITPDSRGNLRMLSRSSKLLAETYSRWYAGGKQSIPHDLWLDETAAIFWCVGAWADKPLVFTGMGDAASKMGMSLAGVTGWRVCTGGGIVLVDEPQQKIREWLGQRVPAEVLD